MANKKEIIFVGHSLYDDSLYYAFIGARGSNKSYNVINIAWEEVSLRKRRKCSRKHISRRK